MHTHYGNAHFKIHTHDLTVLTRVHLADLLNEGLVETRDNGATYWNHEVLVQALHKGIDSSNTSTLVK